MILHRVDVDGERRWDIALSGVAWCLRDSGHKRQCNGAFRQLMDLQSNFLCSPTPWNFEERKLPYPSADLNCLRLARMEVAVKV